MSTPEFAMLPRSPVNLMVYLANKRDLGRFYSVAFCRSGVASVEAARKRFARSRLIDLDQVEIINVQILPEMAD